ncbi:TFP11-domain-containing protein [Hygrophoropsis aurantiaca]|uniref:TFP11-domain-containing protein n=1 Tax=Hygrophoropsis aurantiaca TaxID=72124 RepID=A0ACB8ANT9_9AGAM|nr:TFP11-domain-containing protein [Hygrophoropsis aurantiaca]
MARRKRQFLDDDSDSDSSQNSDDDVPPNPDEDPDVREERSLFENPYQRKRRRKNGKEDAIYGVFGDDSEDERDFRAQDRKKTDWTKAPAFVAGDKVNLDKDTGVDSDAMNSDPGDDSSDQGEDEKSPEQQPDSDHSRPPSPSVREDKEEPLDRPRMGGIGSMKRSTDGPAAFAKGGIGSTSSKSGIGSTSSNNGSSSAFAKGGLGSAFAKGGIGSAFTKGGIGSATESEPITIAQPSPAKATSNVNDLPSAFGAAPRTQRAFVRSGSASASKPSTPLPAHEQTHFSKIGGTIGAQMLAKMGWQTGTGLGAASEGIVIPIESKLRPKNIGIAFKGFKEKTEQSKLEARRRGEVVSDDEEEIRPGRRKKAGKEKEQQEKRSDAWKKPKKVKVKIEHKTYEEIVAEAGQESSLPNLGQIIDATGRTPREVASLADISLSSWTPSTDPTRIPEVRHNIRLIAEACKTDLDELAREAKALEDRKKFIIQEDAHLRKKVADEADLISRLQQVTLTVDEISSRAKELASVYEATLDSFSPLFSKLLLEFPVEFQRYRLDEIVVAAIAPIVRRIIAQWNPLEDPFGLIATFRTWKQALKINNVEEAPQTQVDVYGTKTVLAPVQIEQPMTPFESLLWNIWLPKVRSCINNDWTPEEPQVAVKLYEAWSTFLPPFIRDNMLDQLILPKVSKSVADWSARRNKVPLQIIVFPWLPHLGPRVDDVLGEARRKVKSILRSWTPGGDTPTDLSVWRDVFDASEWDALMLKYVVPKLGAHLRTDFSINPRAQKLEPLQQVLAWTPLLRSSILSTILETEFFPKWLDVLHIWLVQPRVSFEEVVQWYEWWKSCFSEDVRGLEGVKKGFTAGLQLMNKAIELGTEAPSKLPHPSARTEPMPQRTSTPTPRTLPSRVHEVTFRAIVEEFAAEHNLLFVPTGRAHERSRMPLFRVTSSADGKRGGLLVYIQDDAVWAPANDGEKDEYRAIPLEEMVLRANK